MALITSNEYRGTCPLCGADKRTCGGHPTVSPVDIPTDMKEPVMTEPEELRVYTYNLHGNEVTGKLSAADAEKYGATPAEDAEADRPATKARKPANKAVTADDDDK